MKRRLAILTIAALALTCRAAPNITITNHIPNYVSALSFTNAGDTGLNVGTNYLCLNIGDLALLTTNQADMASGDIRRVQYAIANYWFRQYDDSTNAPVYGTITESSAASSSTNATIFMTYTFKVWLDLNTGSSVIPDE